ncbi:hypothetical protein J421_4636 (plasmid) [Gemmatirosa kalamazoonensis]|uniref:HTH cro/C1-type domain-containing protein n=2 Tax=Gemmatirosa kalamazoonensis TaxID=861299 RepID=W0RN21_9BACT|nr:hypothetical protein J421_4568 [Gemmatirosa kalamazoonensis]AHG92171.1 hypothetical protein J421_4636 [Gemmatirosa kalamazoonensis]
MPDTPPTLGARLKQARRQKAAREGRDYTQAALAQDASVAPVSVSRYESNVQEPSLELIQRMAAVLGVSPGWLAFGDEDDVPNDRRAPTSMFKTREQLEAEEREQKDRGA